MPYPLTATAANVSALSREEITEEIDSIAGRWKRVVACAVLPALPAILRFIDRSTHTEMQQASEELREALGGR